MQLRGRRLENVICGIKRPKKKSLDSTRSPVRGSRTDRVGSISKQLDRRVECDPLRILIHAYGFRVFIIVFACRVQSSLVWLGLSVSFVSYRFRARHELNPPVHQDIGTTTTLVERLLRSIKIAFGIVAYLGAWLNTCIQRTVNLSECFSTHHRTRAGYTTCFACQS